MKSIISCIVYLSMFHLLLGCQDRMTDSKASGDDRIINPVTEEKCDSSTLYDGITDITEVTDTTAKVSWALDPNTIGYILFRKHNDKLSIVKRFDGSISHFTVTGLDSQKNYRYLVRTVSANGKFDCNENFKDVLTTEKETFISCQEINTHYQGAKPSGVYEIDPDLSGGNAPVEVYCDMDNNNGGWTRVFRHDTTAGLFANSTQAMEHNIHDPLNAKYSILSKLPEFMKDGKYQFWLFYPEYDGADGGNIWTQTSNPVTDPISGYVSIRETYNGMHWGGLEKSSYSGTLIDGSVGSSWWFYAVGASRYWPSSGTIPGPMRSQGVEQVELYIK